MKKIIILLFLIISTFYSCTNKISNDKNQFKSEEKQREIENSDDTIIFKASSKEKNIDTKDIISKVESDLTQKGALVKIINRQGDSVYIMTTESEAEDIRIHKLNISEILDINKYIKGNRNNNYEEVSKLLRKGEYLIIPANIKNNSMEEAISWISSDGRINVYEIKELDTYEE